MNHADWVGSVEAGRILSLSPPTASRLLKHHSIPSRQLAPGEKYQGRVQFPRSEVQRLAESLNSGSIDFN
jgi:hypothetical protein